MRGRASLPVSRAAASDGAGLSRLAPETACPPLPSDRRRGVALVWPAVFRTPPGSSAGRRAHHRLGPGAATGRSWGVRGGLRRGRPRRAGAQPGVLVLARRALLAAAAAHRTPSPTFGLPRACLGTARHHAGSPRRGSTRQVAGLVAVLGGMDPTPALGPLPGRRPGGASGSRGLARIELTGRCAGVVLGGCSLLVFGSTLRPFLVGVMRQTPSSPPSGPSIWRGCPRAGRVAPACRSVLPHPPCAWDCVPILRWCCSSCWSSRTYWCSGCCVVPSRQVSIPSPRRSSMWP